MLLWLMVGIALAIFGVIEIILNFTMPFVALRAVLLFLLVMGMSYRIYLMEQGGEKESLKSKVRELEDKVRQLEMESV
jgi:Tfp pilus assembly protein PilO